MYGFQWLLSIPFGLGGALVGAIYPATVVLGVHHMFNALEATLIANTGVDNFSPIISCCNVAQGAACLAVFVKTRRMKMKEFALPSGISGFLGITEPAIYGVNLPNMKPFVAAMVGAAVGGALSSLFGVVSIAYGITGLFGFLITTGYTLQYAICILVSAGVAFGLTTVLYRDESERATVAETTQVVAETQATANQAGAIAEAANDTEPVQVVAETLASPMSGTAIALSSVPDPVFASEAMGKGEAVEPTEGKVLSPVDGTVTALAETGHAIGLLSDGGAEVLIHIGIDTVELRGASFSARCRLGDKVRKGDLLMDVDLAAVEAAGKQTTTMVVVTNTDAYSSVTGADGPVTAGDPLVELK